MTDAERKSMLLGGFCHAHYVFRRHVQVMLIFRMLLDHRDEFVVILRPQSEVAGCCAGHFVCHAFGRNCGRYLRALDSNRRKLLKNSKKNSKNCWLVNFRSGFITKKRFADPSSYSFALPEILVPNLMPIPSGPKIVKSRNP